MNNKTLDKFRNYEFAVNCETEEEAKEFIGFCYKNEIRWSNGTSGNRTIWYVYKKDTCYMFNTEYNHLLYCGISLCKHQNTKIITYQEFMNLLKQEGENKTMKTIKVTDLNCDELEVLDNGTLRVIKKKGKFVPKYREELWYISLYGIANTYMGNTVYNENYLKYNLVFETHDECKEYADYLKVLDKYSYEFSEEEWKNRTIEKHYINYNVIAKKIWKGCSQSSKQEKTYFKSKDDIDYFIKEVGEDNVKKFMFDIWE